MTLLFVSNTDDPVEWREGLARVLPDLEVRIWPDIGPAGDIRYALVWKARPGILAGLPNLQFIQSLGMGVDHIFDDPALPDGIPVARLVDPDLVRQMGEYVLATALRHHRRLDEYERIQQAGEWRRLDMPDTGATRIGILGLGEIGAPIAALFVELGFSVAGWSRTEKKIPGVEGFCGAAGLPVFLARTDILVCLLPLTKTTENILDKAALARLPEGAYVINLARGQHIVEEDLLAAIESGHLSGAALDVFRTEPLPKDHPFWTHPRIRITPHIAGITNPASALAQVAENIRRVRGGKKPLNLVDPKRGY
ncbi:MAG: 2-hydroxyacid dehydrogenase [Alphaproteobacteria bacterium]